MRLLLFLLSYNEGVHIMRFKYGIKSLIPCRFSNKEKIRLKISKMGRKGWGSRGKKGDIWNSVIETNEVCAYGSQTGLYKNPTLKISFLTRINQRWLSCKFKAGDRLGREDQENNRKRKRKERGRCGLLGLYENRESTEHSIWFDGSYWVEMEYGVLCRLPRLSQLHFATASNPKFVRTRFPQEVVGSHPASTSVTTN